jgi:4-hydroxysphinganine ceramide fatty acyl 2-hydroxylase
MPSQTLPTLSRAEIASHNTARSCYVTLGNNVYDVTDFLDSHPGGAGLVLEYAGKDIADILKDEVSHTHSDAAYEVLDDSLVGFVASTKLQNGSATSRKTGAVETEEEEEARFDSRGRPVHPKTGMSCEDDLSKDTDFDTDYKTHKFLDLGRPLFPQIWYGGFSKEFYLDQVHRPRHYKGGESAPLFGNFLEPLTKTPWWLIPTIWLPAMFYGLYVARDGFERTWHEAAVWSFGFAIWSLLEYILHRFLFHLDG